MYNTSSVMQKGILINGEYLRYSSMSFSLNSQANMEIFLQGSIHEHMVMLQNRQYSGSISFPLYLQNNELPPVFREIFDHINNPLNPLKIDTNNIISYFEANTDFDNKITENNVLLSIPICVINNFVLNGTEQGMEITLGIQGIIQEDRLLSDFITLPEDFIETDEFGEVLTLADCYVQRKRAEINSLESFTVTIKNEAEEYAFFNHYGDYTEFSKDLNQEMAIKSIHAEGKYTERLTHNYNISKFIHGGMDFDTIVKFYVRDICFNLPNPVWNPGNQEFQPGIIKRTNSFVTQFVPDEVDPLVVY